MTKVIVTNELLKRWFSTGERSEFSLTHAIRDEFGVSLHHALAIIEELRHSQSLDIVSREGAAWYRLVKPTR